MSSKIFSISDERNQAQGFWIFLKSGWCWDSDGLHTIHEETKQQAYAELENTKPCSCKECVS